MSALALLNENKLWPWTGGVRKHVCLTKFNLPTVKHQLCWRRRRLAVCVYYVVHIVRNMHAQEIEAENSITLTTYIPVQMYL